MSDSPKIVFQKERKVNEILRDAFDVLKFNYRNFFQKNIKIVALFFILEIVAYMFLFYFKYNYLHYGYGFDMFTGVSLVVNFIFILYFTILEVVTFIYFKYYINDEQINLKTYKKEVYDILPSLLGLNIMMLFLMMIGFILLIIPGIYLFVSLSLSPVILIFEEKKIFESFKHSIKIIKNNWWSVFSILFFLFLILLLFNFSYSFTVNLYSNFKVLFTESNSYTANVLNDPVLFFLFFILLIVNSIIYVYAAITLLMLYFNIMEKRTHSNLYSEIETIGTDFEN